MIVIQSVRIAAALACLGLFVTVGRTDVANRKIHNRHIRIGLLALFLCYGGLLIHTVLGKTGYVEEGGFLVPGFFLDAFLHVGVSAVAALAIWWWCLWPAGDAKLFILLACFGPVLRAVEGFDPHRSWLLALINVFVPAAFFLLAQSGWYVWQIYLKKQTDFLSSIGWGHLVPYLWEGRKQLDIWREKTLADLKETAHSPGPFLLTVVRWLVSTAAMSALLAFLSARVQSTLLLSGVGFLLMLAWGQFQEALGRRFSLALGVALPLFLTDWNDPAAVQRFLGYFSNVSVFSLSLNWAMGLTRRLLEERGMFIAPLFAVVSWGLPMLFLNYLRGWAFGHTLMVWALLGGVFGLGYVFVKVLEEQDRPHVPPDALEPTLVLAPAFAERVRNDPEYDDDECGRFFADGLTKEQVGYVRDWCHRHGVSLVPLRTASSFSLWIFFGYLITWLLNGSVLQWLYS